ncbi:hypothetical protein SteCoe_14379 [Stentor coeruleus]|uniref:Uncharacterized protein n=1 Tax=Stentor coeruleus TaxID=5963 RepID=A0A1R2C412_9CILI|nr:hypothetical protein SteCoe_15317 [Stentor coeruleus]OMJ84493.1 hypothetical protein SteCoe_14379 [Stentor coeruleus]
MSELENSVTRNLLFLVKDRKISKIEYNNLLKVFLSKDTMKRLEQIPDDEGIRSELLQILLEPSVNILIPTHNTSIDELSSPLDTFLLSKKRRAERNPDISTRGIGMLIKIDG